MNDETSRPKLVPVPAEHEASEEPAAKETIKSAINPFANLEALRNPQDYEEFLGGESVSAFAVRTLREGMHLRSIRTPITACMASTPSRRETGLTSYTRNFVKPWVRCRAGAICMSPWTDTANISCF
jgi:hypothetical protein